MWMVYLFDAANPEVSPFSAGLQYFTVWGKYVDQYEAIDVRNDLVREGAYAKIIWRNN
jgi:hypothetical protein